MLLPHEFGIVDEMPIAHSSDGTARVALTAAPARHIFKGALGKFVTSRPNARSPAEVTILRRPAKYNGLRQFWARRSALDEDPKTKKISRTIPTKPQNA